MAAQRSAATDDPEPEDIYPVGTLAKVVQFSRLSDGTLKALIEGRERVTIDSFQATAPLFTVRYTPLESKTPAKWPRMRALMDSVAREFANYVGQTPQLPEEAETALETVTDPESMVNVIASNLMIGPDRKQELLEGDEPEARLLLLLETLIQENEFIALENEISERVHDSFERQQRRVFLHERLKVLQEELGEEGEEDSERGAYLKQLESKKLPEATAAALTKEIKRLSDLPPLVRRGRGRQDVPRHGAGSALGHPLSLGHPGRGGGGARARRDPLRPQERQGPHHRVSGGGVAAGRHASQRHPLPGRARRGWARPRWPWPRRRAWSVRCSASAWAGCATRARSGGTGAPTWGPCPAASSTRSSGPVWTTR